MQSLMHDIGASVTAHSGSPAAVKNYQCVNNKQKLSNNTKTMHTGMILLGSRNIWELLPDGPVDCTRPAVFVYFIVIIFIFSTSYKFYSGMRFFFLMYLV